jgi:hypothetical protein
MEPHRQADRLILQEGDGEGQARVEAAFWSNGGLELSAYGSHDPEDDDPQASITDQIRLTHGAWQMLCETYALRWPAQFRAIVAKWEALRRPTPPRSQPRLCHHCHKPRTDRSRLPTCPRCRAVMKTVARGPATEEAP